MSVKDFFLSVLNFIKSLFVGNMLFITVPSIIAFIVIVIVIVYMIRKSRRAAS